MSPYSRILCAGSLVCDVTLTNSPNTLVSCDTAPTCRVTLSGHTWQYNGNTGRYAIPIVQSTTGGGTAF